MNITCFDIFGAEVRGYIQDDYDTLVSHRIRPCLVICAGGAYKWRSPREKDPPAFEFLSMGYQVFILEYSCGAEAAGYTPLRQLGETLKIIRHRSSEFHIDPSMIAVMGFSAGGHLAASLGVYWNDAELGLGPESRPDALILCYPVISTREFAHDESAVYVSGGDDTVRERMNLHTHVTPDFPPCFIWHGGEDTSVPCENSLMLACALRKCNVPLELHLFGYGAHGISTCTVEVETPDSSCRPWVDLCRSWLNRRFSFIP